MLKLSPAFRSFGTKITLVLVLAMLFSGAMSNFLIYRFALNSQFHQLREKLMIIAQTAALNIDADMLMQVPLSKEGIYTPQYKIIAEKLKKIKKANPLLRYIYTMTKTEKEGIWQFIVDPVEPTQQERRKGLTSYPGDEYNAARFPEMLDAFNGPSADKKLVVDEWGTTLSGYAPIYDGDGKAVAVLGVDILANDVYAIQKEVNRSAMFVLLLGVIISVLVGVLLSRRMSKPIRELVRGTQRIAHEDLKYRVNIKSGDELAELANAFNQMAASLYESRKKLHTYYYRIVQSLVRIIEARDHYTRGHSERVAEYAQEIAARMGLPAEQIELLKEAGVLHDIGKLGIEERILNKKEKLNEGEWEEIKKHPVIGEDILKPVLLNSEMLRVIRSHHERYDGKGYPDRLSADEISLFSQILSVADAYDAMTSPRAYRPAMSKSEAMAELNKNKGSQFNPKVVNIFLQILEEEK